MHTLKTTSRAIGLLPLLLLLALLPSSCVIDDLLFEGRHCSDNRGCGGGTVCDPAKRICVRGAPSLDLQLDAPGDGPRAEQPLVDLPASSSEARRDTRPPDRPVPDKKVLSRDTVRLPDLTKPKDLRPPDLKPDAGPCGGPCSGSAICCKTSNGYLCTTLLSQCICDPATGTPCGGTYPICCTVSAGDPKCRASSASCNCDESTAEPCTGAYGICCIKAPFTTARCYADADTCVF